MTNNTPIFRRVYSQTVSAPAVGYYSQRYGAGGIEAYADAALRGPYSRVDDLFHRRRIGTPITLTLDSELQIKLNEAMRATTPATQTRGAAVVLDWQTGEVLALVSTPSFDANQLDAEWDALRTNQNAPLVNRATQGLYQPGELLQWLVERQEAENKQHGAQQARQETSWLDTLVALNLDKPVPFELMNEAVSLPATATFSETIGQGQLRVTPLRVAATVASLAAGGTVTPTLMRMQPATDSTPARLQEATFITFAPISKDLLAGWLVQVKGSQVTVIVLEQGARDEAALRHIAQTISAFHAQ